MFLSKNLSMKYIYYSNHFTAVNIPHINNEPDVVNKYPIIKPSKLGNKYYFNKMLEKSSPWNTNKQIPTVTAKNTFEYYKNESLEK